MENLKEEHIGYQNGVMGGFVSTLNAFSAPGDPVLVHSPTYIGFTDCLLSNGRKIVYSPLKKDDAGIWRMDYQDMERKLEAQKIHLAVFCNPHNPTGRVWARGNWKKRWSFFVAMMS